jgi:RNA polymerase sigma-70 factor (ECF subfamily)
MGSSPPNDERFRRILDDNHRAIQLYCARRLSPADAHEASADVFVVAWQKRDSIPEESQARPWLYGIARNVVRNHARGARRRTRLGAKVLAISEVAPSDPELQVVRRLEDRLVGRAVEQLSERDREILMLHAWEDLTVAEIAVALDLSPTATHMRLQRALKRLAKELQRSGYEPPLSDRPRAVGEGGGK